MLVRWNNALFNRTHNRTFPRNFEARRVTSYGCVQGAAEARRLPTRLARVTCFRYASGRFSSSSLSLSLSSILSSSRSDGCYSTRSATFPRTKARKRGVVAWAGGQSYRGGWLAPVNGFRGQWRYTARSHGPSPKNYEPASTASFRGGRISLLALDLESRRRQKRKKRSRLRPLLPP